MIRLVVNDTYDRLVAKMYEKYPPKRLMRSKGIYDNGLPLNVLNLIPEI